MKEFILKQEKVIHLLSLIIIVASVFLKSNEIKFILLLLGIGGLATIYFYRDKKTSFYIFVLLFIITIVGYYLLTNGYISLPGA